MLVEEIMSRKIVNIDCNNTVFEACKVFSESKVGCLVVMDKKIIVGIVTERDTIERVILQNRDSKKTKVREIMSPNIITIHALAPIVRAAKIMNESNIKKLPVILNNETVGIITETDLSLIIDAFSEAIEALVQFYSETRENVEKIMDDWEGLLVNLKDLKKLAGQRKINTEHIKPLKEEVVK